MSFDLKVEQLEKEIIDSRDRSIGLSSKNIKLKKEIFLLKEELKEKDKELEYKNIDIKYYKKEIYKLQEISEDLAKELDESLDELKFWYKLKYPSIKTVLTKYMEMIKDAYNNFKRSIKALWQDRLQLIRKN